VTKDAVERYLRHIDAHGTDMIEDTVRNDRRLTDEEKAAVVAYANIQATPLKRPKGKRK
jgi:hypothetical protein